MSAFKQRLKKLLNNSRNDNLDNLLLSSTFKPNRSYGTLQFKNDKQNVYYQTLLSNMSRTRLYSNSPQKKSNLQLTSYRPSKIFTMDKIHQENDHNKLTYLFRSCTTKDIHNTISEPILISPIPRNEPDFSTRNKDRMKRKVFWLNQQLQLQKSSKSNNGNLPMRAFSPMPTITNEIRILSPFRSKGEKKEKMTFLNVTTNKNKIPNSLKKPLNSYIKKGTCFDNEIEKYGNGFKKIISRSHYS